MVLKFIISRIREFSVSFINAIIILMTCILMINFYNDTHQAMLADRSSMKRILPVWLLDLEKETIQIPSTGQEPMLHLHCRCNNDLV